MVASCKTPFMIKVLVSDPVDLQHQLERLCGWCVGAHIKWGASMHVVQYEAPITDNYVKHMKVTYQGHRIWTINC